jgi:hypothetical protein
MSFADAQVKLATITQIVLARLYTERRTPCSWAQTHARISSMMSELDAWALETVPQHPPVMQVVSEIEKQQLLLKKQYCRIRILIAWPCLHRIEQCLVTSSEDFTLFDHETAELCIRTAQDVAILLPDEVDLKVVFEKGPWWTIVHNSKSCSLRFVRE